MIISETSKSRKLLGWFGIVFVSWSCFDAPEYSIIPAIEFYDIRFSDVENAQDSLVLSFSFTDGDGDLGLTAEETNPPFHSFNVVLDSTAVFDYIPSIDQFVVRAGTGNFVELNKPTTFPLYLVEPVFGIRQGIYAENEISLPQYTCKDYFIIEDDTIDQLTGDNSDTVLIQINPFNKNIIIEFYRKRGGQYQNITNNLAAGECQDTFSSRFPIFDQQNLGRTLRGVISYNLISSAFKPVFINDTIMIEFFIYDRALHKSNVVRTPDFTLSGILD